MMDINELGSRFIKENKDTVNKNAFIFNRLVTKPITKGFLNKTFVSLDLDDFFVIKKLIFFISRKQQIFMDREMKIGEICIHL